ncbi:FMN-binding protein [Cellulomonas sp. C5510]|uniref:FMN-binding protein n=1 Tax=Cellulomonas sp. C5510 TaxID=2871170 RepID=UPI001C96FDE6|nr:FMN-binding protein [Cellulomonas sp. C5510]QZN86828.1 FMN-binding protein [Cellulomonas sp. C5510]
MAPSVRRRTLGLLSGISVVVALAACAGAGAATEDDAPGAGSGAGTEAGSGSAGSGDLADGTYDAEGSYSTPGGQESIQVELTVADGVVTDVTVTPEATGGNAARFQEEFASGIADVVVGQDLAGLSVDKVSGSSLTGDGFNAALDEIRADAAA